MRNQFLHHAPLGVVGLAQEGVERRNHGHFQLANQRQQMAAGGPAVDPKLVLNADDVHVADVEEVRRALVGGKILLFDFETHDAGILVPLLDIINRHSEALALWVLRRHRSEKVGSKGGNATLARQVIAEKCDFSNFRFCFHEFGRINRGLGDTPYLYPRVFRASGQNSSVEGIIRLPPRGDAPGPCRLNPSPKVRWLKRQNMLRVIWTPGNLRSHRK